MAEYKTHVHQLVVSNETVGDGVKKYLQLEYGNQVGYVYDGPSSEVAKAGYAAPIGGDKFDGISDFAERVLASAKELILKHDSWGKDNPRSSLMRSPLGFLLSPAAEEIGVPWASEVLALTE